MAEPADWIAALVALLKADGDIAAAVGTRVFGGELPAEEAAAMPRKALVLEPSGGSSLTGRSFIEHDTSRFDLFAYGATPREAGALADLAGLALRNARRGVRAGVLIHWVQPAGGSSSGRDPSLAWPRAFRSFQVLHSLQEI